MSRDAEIDVIYITERILVLAFPSVGSENAYRSSLKEVTHMLRTKHGARYRIFNVSKRRSDLARFNANVTEFGWPEELAPPLDRLCAICKAIENWLNGDRDNILVVHSKGGKSRPAIVIAAYMHYTNICASEDSALDRFAMRRFSDDYVGGIAQPSHCRYIRYFSALLSGATKINGNPIYLQQITLFGLSKIDSKSLNPIIKIYERMKPVFTSGNFIAASKSELIVNFAEPFCLRGDVLIKCFQKSPLLSSQDRHLLFRCQFNTCALEFPPGKEIHRLRFRKDDLDEACFDRSFPDDMMAEFVFVIEPNLICIDRNDRQNSSEFTIGRSDSYENFDTILEDSEIPPIRNCDVPWSPLYASIIKPNDSADSGVVVDLPEHPNTANGCRITHLHNGQVDKKSNGQIPVPPPKPKTTKLNSPEECRPRSVRPSGMARSHSPTVQEGHSTPVIDVDLVGKDRYDPASKAFSYVPARALNEHFTAPKKLTQLVQRVQDRQGRDVDLELASSSPVASEYSSSNKKTNQTGPKELEKRKDDGKINGVDSPNEEEQEEKAQIFHQACKATKINRTKYHSYRILNDDAYSSDMDDMCDPDFYLSFVPEPSKIRPVSKGGEFRCKEQPLEGRGKWSIPPESGKNSAEQVEKNECTKLDRRSRSVTSTPVPSFRRMSTQLDADKYDSLTDAENDDDWLESQLNKLRHRRDVLDPDVRRRKRQEKLLLEELKYVHDDRMCFRGRNEADYSVEGIGIRMTDPLEDYRREEERLRMLQSPYGGETSGPRRIGGPTSQCAPTTIVRSKPPTLPPRENSRSPPLSPRGILSENSGQKIDRRTPPLEIVPTSYHRCQPSKSSPYYAQLAALNAETPSDDDELKSGDFDHLEAIVSGNRQRMAFKSTKMTTIQQSPKSILKRRGSDGAKFEQDELKFGTCRHRSQATATGGQSVDSSPMVGRSETPSFPVKKRETPLPFHPLLFEGADDSTNNEHRQVVQQYSRPANYRSPSPGSIYYGQSRRSSITSLEPMEVLHHHPVFVKDTSKYWYKPTITREEAINMLKDKPPGTFVVRDSNSFPGAFGLALKVVSPPPGVQTKFDGTELVRHFLIEPSSKGVKLKGCNNEPVFGTLSALVYQHSITALALPEKLLLPDYDPSASPEHLSAAQALLDQGAACNVTYILSCDTESLTGPEAVRRCVSQAFLLLTQKRITTVHAHFKVSTQGVTVTDNTRKAFFRRHYPVQAVTYAGIDPDDRRCK